MIVTIVLSLLILSLLLIFIIRSKLQSIKLKKEHKRARVMLDTLPIACFMGSVDGDILDCNTEAVRLFHVKDKQDFINRFEKDLSPEYQSDGQKSSEAIYNHGVKAAQTGKSVFNWMHKRPDGTPIPSIVTLENVSYEGKMFLMAYIRDMREHINMTNEIDRRSELLRTVNSVSSILLEPDINNFEETLSKSMGIMAEVAGVDRVVIWRNVCDEPAVIRGQSKEIGSPCFSLSYQWEKDNFKSRAKDGIVSPDLDFGIHKAWNDILSHGDCLNSLVRDMLPTERMELMSRNISSVLAIPVLLQDHFWGFVGFDCYKTERLFKDDEVLILRSASRMIVNAVIRNEMSVELVSAKEQAEQSNRSKSIFLSHMSHEIRTPMNAILGIAEIQLRDDTNKPVTMEAFGKIYESGDLLLNIINDILDLSKIESGNLELVPVKYDIPSLINDTVHLNRLRYDSKQIDFILHVDENTPINLLGDELRIKQVLNNILSNAYKYTDKGKIEFSVFTEDDNNDSDGNITIVFRISDTGQGMTEDQLKRLYNEYARFNLKTNRTTVGAGLGMSITKRLVNLMNGAIDAQSEPGKGSTFTVRLPQKKLDCAVCGNDVAEKLRNYKFQNSTIVRKTNFLREYMPYGSVLVVDDVDTNIYVTRGMLLPYGLKIDTASNAFTAIEKIKNGALYDIVFMDHMMPGMDGIEAVKVLRELGYKNTIIALTANALVGRAQMFLQNGFDGFISKPIDSRELNLFLNDFIRNKKTPEVVEAARREQREMETVNSDTQIHDMDYLSEMNNFFIHDAKNAVNILRSLNKKINSLDDTEIGLYTTTVHGMKSALANIGENNLSDSALKLEQAGVRHNFLVMSSETGTFINALESMIAEVRPGSKNTMAITDDIMNNLREKLRIVQKACAAFDKDAIKYALNDLKPVKWPPEIQDLLDEISINVLHSAFKKITALTEHYLQEYK